MADGHTLGEAAGLDFAARNLSFWIKSRFLMCRRAVADLLSTSPPLRRVPFSPSAVQLVVDEHKLYSLTNPSERELEMGKVQNLRVAAAAVNGLVIEPGETFSFWRAVGRTTRRKGYAVGRELRLGCMIPTVGGGICQLTNALSRVAHRAGMEVVERHSHTVQPEGFFIDGSTDATVFWNYLDFRFRSRVRVRIGATLSESTLIVRLDALP